MEYTKGKWTDEELNILKTYYVGGYAKLVEMGLHRTEASVIQKMRKEGIYFKKEVPGGWTEEEVKLLVDSYKKEGMQGALSCGIDKKPLAIRTKVRMLGLSGNEYEGILWNDNRLNILRTYYPTEGAVGVRRRGIKEPKDVIIAKAIELGLGVKFE